MTDLDHIASSFNARAERYVTDDWHRRYADQLVAATPLRDGDRVLDAGTGTGFAACAIARRVGPGGRVLGVDISPKMLEHARHYASTCQLSNIDWLQADVSELPHLADGSFDAVACSAGLLYMPVAKCLRAWHRLLKPGGIVAFSTMRLGSPAPGRLFRECAEQFGLRVRDRSEELGTENRCRRALVDAGFEPAQIVADRVDFDSYDPALAWESSCRAAGAAMAMLSSDAQATLRNQYLAALERAMRDDLSMLARVDVLYAIGQRANQA